MTAPTPPTPDPDAPEDVTGTGKADPAAATGPNAATATTDAPRDGRGNPLREILASSTLVTVLAVAAALVVAAVLIAAADPAVQRTAGYIFAKPADFFGAIADAVGGAYTSLFRGAIVDPEAKSFERFIRPFTETMTAAVPLILAGLGLGIGFRAGLFNIGAQGQVLIGAAAAGFVGFTFQLPAGLHLVAAAAAGVAAAALWAGIAGLLKARTGANEVIVTIMLNSIALLLVGYLLTTDAWTRGGSNNPISPPIRPSATYPLLLGDGFRLHAGFLVAIAAAFAVWWLMERSTLGFKFRAVGANDRAARTAGIKVTNIYVWVMLVAGGLAGLAGTAQVLGTEKVLQASTAGSIGFDAITVALLGRSRPLGTVLAALLFGALRAGSPLMQSVSGTPIDIVQVVQALIVLLIAAPPLVRWIFRLPTPGLARSSKEVAA